MMKFTALPVNNGDSFLLQVDDYVILVDGGMKKAHIVKLLEAENILGNHINLLVCTHYDFDHINGIIGILESKKFTFDEIWLPEIIGSLTNTLSKNKYKLLKYLWDGKLPHEVDSNDDFHDDDAVKIEEQFEENNSLEKINLNDLKFGIRYMKNHYYLNKPYDDEHYHKFEKMMDNMYSYASLVYSSLNNGAKVKWFAFKDELTDICYGYNLYSQNAVQIGTSIYNEKVFFNLLYKTTLSEINKQSLVFKFKNEEYPNILYTADSDLSFTSTSRPINLVDNSIVTAPHHGSDTNDPAYSKISQNDSTFTFVRSYSSRVKQLSNIYIQKNKKFCTICRKDRTTTQKVELNLDKNGFTTSANRCICY